jgi:DNA repair photolyase
MELELVTVQPNSLALNPILGCNRGCTYCFLRAQGLTGVTPTINASPKAAIQALLDHPEYLPVLPVTVYNHTEPFATNDTAAHCRELLQHWQARLVPNPLIIVTKGSIDTESLRALQDFQSGTGRLCVYISFSGLPGTVEKGTRREALLSSMAKLSASTVPLIHYWRPITPLNSTTRSVREVLAAVADRADCSVVSGLKVYAEMRPFLADIWPEISASPDLTSAFSHIPHSFIESLSREVSLSHPEYPVYFSSACALSRVFPGRPVHICGRWQCSWARCIWRSTPRCLPRARPRDDDSTELAGILADAGVAPPAWRILATGEIEVDVPVSLSLARRLTRVSGRTLRVVASSSDYWPSAEFGQLPHIWESGDHNW